MTGRSSGYCSVMCGSNICLKVRPRPDTMAGWYSSSYHFSFLRSTTLPMSASEAPGVRLPQYGQQDLHQPQRQQHLPAQLHELVEAEARDGPAHPDVEEQEHERLEQQADEAQQRAPVAQRAQRGLGHEGDVPAAEEEHRDQA